MRLIALPLLALALAAQEQPPVMELSLRQAVDLALAPDGAARLQLAQEAIRVAEYRSRQARGALLPQLDGSYSYANQTRNLKAFGITFAAPIPGFSAPTFVGPFNVNDARVNIVQSVLDLASWKRYQVSQAATAQVKAETAAARHQTADAVARAYLTALRAQAHIDAQQANVSLAEALVKLAGNQKDAGTGTGIDVTRARAQLANERQRLLAARNDFDRASLLLLRAINAPLAARVKLTDVLALQPLDTAGAEAAIRAAQEARPDVKAQQQRELVARLQRQAVERERLPSLVAAGDYGVIGPTFQENAYPTRSVGLALRVPLWDGGRREARRAESMITQRQEAIRTRDLARQVELEIRLALESIESAKAQVEAASEGLTLTENELAQARRRFEAGFAPSLEVTDAQTRLARARDNRIAALYLYNLARLDFQTAMGQMP
jgi:outer membrane protein